LARDSGQNRSATSQSGAGSGVAVPNAKIRTPQQCLHACRRLKGTSLQPDRHLTGIGILNEALHAPECAAGDDGRLNGRKRLPSFHVAMRNENALGGRRRQP
jgi:hypothetical protein